MDNAKVIISQSFFGKRQKKSFRDLQKLPKPATQYSPERVKEMLAISEEQVKRKVTPLEMKKAFNILSKSSLPRKLTIPFFLGGIKKCAEKELDLIKDSWVKCIYPEFEFYFTDLIKGGCMHIRKRGYYIWGKGGIGKTMATTFLREFFICDTLKIENNKLNFSKLFLYLQYLQLLILDELSPGDITMSKLRQLYDGDTGDGDLKWGTLSFDPRKHLYQIMIFSNYHPKELWAEQFKPEQFKPGEKGEQENHGLKPFLERFKFFNLNENKWMTEDEMRGYSKGYDYNSELENEDEDLLEVALTKPKTSESEYCPSYKDEIEGVDDFMGKSQGAFLRLHYVKMSNRNNTD
jgi:hypothetical protein